MSGLLRGIGKVFKRVAKVVRKIALPVLAIGAVALTGGAALGVLPSLGSIAGGLGLSPALTGILTTAAKGATIGAVGSAATGGNIIKGATTGLVVGGATGGLSSALSKPASVLATGSPGGGYGGGVSVAGQVPSAPAQVPNVGLGNFASQAAQTIQSAGVPLSSSVPIPGTVSPTAVASGGGLGGFIQNNPILAGNLIQGLGNGLAASSQAKAQRKAVKDERKQIADNYKGTGLYRLGDEEGDALPDAGTHFNDIVYGRIKRDARSGRIVAA